jgi:hypothetical protein
MDGGMLGVMLAPLFAPHSADQASVQQHLPGAAMSRGWTTSVHPIQRAD